MISNFDTPEDTFRRKRLKVVIACTECRRRKTKCDGNEPCASCTKAKVECTYVPSKTNMNSLTDTFQKKRLSKQDRRPSLNTTTTTTTTPFKPPIRHSFSHFRSQPVLSKPSTTTSDRHTTNAIASIEQRLAAIERILRLLLEATTDPIRNEDDTIRLPPLNKPQQKIYENQMESSHSVHRLLNAETSNECAQVTGFKPHDATSHPSVMTSLDVVQPTDAPLTSHPPLPSPTNDYYQLPSTHYPVLTTTPF
ncbi:uncharacterized protein BX664DRAFT_323523 [Halteromyces radiatus]|uniref:uncharacterized protein n=1 Tax=Halteromyces radiatus TaxID=101107 RepID=UPI00221EB404|nr:uncharacterized protein BX664DRAFT_323523 [Halteromyces radiatus]KAI8096273.1 hypothetical protein BX664DRAFT_323523 [Halteromyces radiatus]